MMLSISMRRADTIARRHHAEQVDKGNVPIVVHVDVVACTAYSLMDDDENAYIVGKLHDAIEDTLYDFNACLRDFGPTVAKAVLLLTHKEGPTYDEYIHTIAQSGNLLAITVKLCDLMHNTDPTRCKTNEQKLARYALMPRYIKAIAVLSEARASL